ncbi:hypothetical protein ACQ5ES_07435 [Pseudidiomarina sp. E22-M8]|uniref:hypothetical protein n=1 Tax=Pseudidiomarina sp. E22-M8 TaxID=3424768 RepID=UPI00403C0FF4
MNIYVGITLGVIIGIVVTLVGHESLASRDVNIKIQTISNGVIAVAACIALIINYFSIKSQRDSRRWEVNKGILLELSTTLSDLIAQTSKLVDNEFCNVQGIPQDHKFTPDNSIYKKFNRHLAHTRDVYGAVLGSQIVSAIEDYRREAEVITKGVEVDAISLFEAYDAELAAQNALQKALSQHIKKCANI